MSINNFKPEIWSAQLLDALENALVYAQPQLVNRDYEGEISTQGQSVHITSIGDPTIFDYDKTANLNYEEVETAGTDLIIDQAKAFAFRLDDVDKAQALLNPMVKMAQNAAYGLRDKADAFVASLYTGVAAGNTLGSTGAPINTYTTATDAYDKVLVPLRTKLDRSNVPTEGRYVVVSPEFEGSLLKDDRFVRVDASGTETGLRNGMVGRAAGFDILKSNNTPVPTGDVQVVQAGYPGAITYAEQILETEALRLQNTIADAIRGLHVYGAKLLRPTGIAVAFIDPA
ncbi:P22 coat protein - protein 5 domain protein [Streptomyces olivaceus]|uniref:P22 phage major capsid protein family protein n=1 Tax=Streptomyces olivaceus TaxID=47716 RepID=UPI001CCAA395|nr:P22 phage major capsid protein family protein [Streptomyces olivaceus]MBZ6207539.1 P22 coat protein - protein 5 domain protein [Streptomyces olivaceus]MBZ6290415.1 P22 coat protein - protein 5 domain protein [Streptomyces olivaceus]MBZ6324367.1 P22 coat protein - protein 5 domain protein [Streptomyces olivaceus]